MQRRRPEGPGPFDSNRPTVASAINAVGTSTMLRLAITTHPVMAPIAAAVTPFTKATMDGSLPTLDGAG